MSDQNERDYKKMKEVVMDEVKRVFSPEFINRINDVIVFHPLSEAEMAQILTLMLTHVRTKIEAQGYKVEFTDETRAYLVKNGFDVNYGARPLARTIQRSIEDPLSEEILLKKFDPGATIYIDVDSANEKLTFSKSPAVKSH